MQIIGLPWWCLMGFVWRYSGPVRPPQLSRLSGPRGLLRMLDDQESDALRPRHAFALAGDGAADALEAYPGTNETARIDRRASEHPP